MQMGGQVEKAITLIRASSSSSPSMYYSYIQDLDNDYKAKPGRSRRARKARDATKVEKKRMNFWTQYCDENPSELECRVYEI